MVSLSSNLLHWYSQELALELQLCIKGNSRMPSLTTGKIYKQQGLLISGSKTSGTNAFTGTHWTSVASAHDCHERLTVVQTWPSLPGVYNTAGKTALLRTAENKVLRSTWIIALQSCVGFCQTLTWISQSCTYVHSLLRCPSTFRPIPPL